MKYCPVCQNSTQQIHKTKICTCGWSYSENTNVSESGMLVSMLLIFTLLMGTFFHFSKWGSYGIDILFATNLEKISICKKLYKYDCMEVNYAKVFESTGDLKVLKQLGSLQFKRNKFQESLKTYKKYLKNTKTDHQANSQYAYSLAGLGELDSAIAYFDSILKKKPRKFMVSVTESYLNMLISHNKIAKAKQVLAWLDTLHKGSKNTQYYIRSWKRKFNI